MDILSEDSYKPMFIFFLLAGVTFSVFASDKEPAQILADSYKLPDRLTSEDAERIISDLNQALGLCRDGDLRFRIKYRIGILYFKAGCFDKACDYFVDISQRPDCPDLIRLFSLNMSGQVHRMQARDKKALDAFENLIALSKRFLPKDADELNLVTVLKLTVSAVFAKAEIYQYQQKFASAISEYNRALSLLKENKVSGSVNYIPLAMDRIAQLNLIKDNLDVFCKTNQQLVEKYPGYYRIPIIRFETEAVKILKEKNPHIDFPRGSYETPAKLITYLKSSRDKDQMCRTLSLLENLCKQYEGTYGGFLLSYHYAWLLDAANQKDAAANVFAKLDKTVVKETYDNPGIDIIVKTIADYAKLQQAIILGEVGNYKQALETLYLVGGDPNDTHLLNLTESVKKSLETLKREVPEDVNDQ
jgi:tetratricopeptide (TPR) repeat protein